MSESQRTEIIGGSFFWLCLWLFAIWWGLGDIAAALRAIVEKLP